MNTTIDQAAITDQDLQNAERLPFDFNIGAKWLLEKFQSTGIGSGKFESGILKLHTGGWSDCEALIDRASISIWWMQWWKSSERGGHYIFMDRDVSIRELQAENKINRAQVQALAEKDAEITRLREIVDAGEGQHDCDTCKHDKDKQICVIGKAMECQSRRIYQRLDRQKTDYYKPRV
jgi:hypothetical protein